MRRHLYPDDWEDISARVRTRARGECECRGECGLHRARRCVERHGEKAKWARGKVCLTVAHLDHDKSGTDEGRMRAMCNRCHLRYDMRFRAERRRRAEELRGQSMLFPVALSDQALA